MNCQESLQVLRNELLRQRLPRNYVDRVTDELADHLADAAAETAPRDLDDSSNGGNTADRLGDPVTLARQITREFQARTFLGRHPALTFVALPAAAMFVAWSAASLLIVGCVELVYVLAAGEPNDFGRWTAAIAAGAIAYAMTYIVPIAACYWLIGAARRTARSLAWTWAATAVLVLASRLFRLYVYRLDDGCFAVDTTFAARYVVSCICFDENCPAGVWRIVWRETLSFGYLALAAVLVGLTVRRTFADRVERNAAFAQSTAQVG